MSKEMQEKTPQLSIIIPTLNEGQFVGNLLEDIVSLTCLDFEVIVTDNNSTDDTVEVVNKYVGEYPNVKLVKCENGGVSSARNKGASEAYGEYLLFLDADVRIDPNYLSASLEEMRNRNLGVANHYSTPIGGKSVDKYLFYFINNLISRPMQYISSLAPGCGGIMVLKSIHDSINGFDEQITTIGEDVDYQKRASRFGKFRMIDSTRSNVDMRRFDKEGRFKVLCKWSLAVIYHLTNRDMSKFPLEYDFGRFDSPSN